MHEFRDGDDRRPVSPPTSQPGSTPSCERLEEVGDLHLHAAAYSSAMDYYRMALSAVDGELPGSQERLLSLRIKLADCLRIQGQLKAALTEFDRAASVARSIGGVEPATVDVRRARVFQAQGRYEEAIALAKRSFAVLSLTDRHGDVAVAQMVLGISEACSGRPTKSEEFFQDALSTYRRIEDEVSQAHVLNNLALLAKRACRWQKALKLYERAGDLLRRHGANVEMCALHLNQAVLLRKMGQRAQSMATAMEGLRLAKTRGDQGSILRFDLLLGQLKIDAGALSDAEDFLLEAKVLAEKEESQRDIALADEFLGDLMHARGELAEAASNYDLAEERAREISPVNDILAEVSRRRAQLLLEQDCADEARQEAERGLELVEASGEAFERGFLLRTRAAALLSLGEIDHGIRVYHEALEQFRRLRLEPEIYSTLVDVAEALREKGDSQDLVVARARLEEALAVDLPVDCSLQRCDAHHALAEVEMALGNFDEALISVFELERQGCSQDSGPSEKVTALRERIERAMSRDAQSSVDSFQLLADLPELIGDAGAANLEALSSVLVATARHLGAERAFVSVRNGRGKTEILANHEMAQVTARALADRALEMLADQSVGQPRVWSQASTDEAWIDGLKEIRRPLDGVVGLRLYDAEEGLEGLFYFDAPVAPGEGLPFGPEALAMASTYVELLRTSVLRTARSRAGRVSLDDEGPFSRVITQSEKIMGVLDLCSKVAASPYTVLFTGETGTGKGLLARIIHDLSPRRDGPFVQVNCAAIPDTLLESELFGHARGAFTGADRDKAGLIVSAAKGTLFLDEVGKMPLPMQAKLLQFLDSHEVRPVGGAESNRVDVRVLCASKRSLEAMVESGDFLEDLYYRLLDFPIDIPPLRERGDDVLLLADAFIDEACEELGRERPAMTRAFAAKLRAYRWPGNVRELQKTVTRAVVMASDDARLRDNHLPSVVRGRTEIPDGEQDRDDTRPLRDQIADLERQVLQSTLDEVEWNRSEAARRLKVSYPTLLQKIRTYNLLAPDS